MSFHMPKHSSPSHTMKCAQKHIARLMHKAIGHTRSHADKHTRPPASPVHVLNDGHGRLVPWAIPAPDHAAVPARPCAARHAQSHRSATRSQSSTHHPGNSHRRPQHAHTPYTHARAHTHTPSHPNKQNERPETIPPHPRTHTSAPDPTQPTMPNPNGTTIQKPHGTGHARVAGPKRGE